MKSLMLFLCILKPIFCQEREQLGPTPKFEVDAATKAKFKTDTIQADSHLPDASDDMVYERDRQILNLGPYETVDDLSDREREYLDTANAYGWDQLDLIANYSN